MLFPILFIIFIAVIWFLGWYISPDRASQPRKLRRFVAMSWILFRRMIAFTGALLSLIFIYFVWISTGNTIIDKILISLALIAMSAFFIFVGIVGLEKHGSSLELYRRIKKKYKIRW
ncbi:hypothetical protein ACLKMH_04930 [Psychromonas sp. KJ10-10]|uniref:hypothetical protein n=1 Tax=Psychromonas sp. KJ10-10 TaxID=3391823 RepID=UPI0039B63911